MNFFWYYVPTCFKNCLKRFRIKTPTVFELCENGNITNLKKMNKQKVIPHLEKCLEIATLKFHKEIVDYLISIGAKPTNELMKIVCENNKYEFVELFLKNGVDPKIVYRYTNSSNIFNIAFRFENKSEIIN